MKFVSETKPEKTLKDRKLPFKSPVPLAWVSYGILTFLNVLFIFPFNDVARGGSRPLFLTLIISLIVLTTAASVFTIFTLRTLRFSDDKLRSRFSFRLLVTAALCDVFALAGGFLIGRNSETACLAQLTALVVNLVVTFCFARTFLREKLPAPKLAKVMKKFEGSEKIWHRVVILPFISLLFIYSFLLLVGLISGSL